jgi:hypothetical protein
MGGRLNMDNLKKKSNMKLEPVLLAINYFGIAAFLNKGSSPSPFLAFASTVGYFSRTCTE